MPPTAAQVTAAIGRLGGGVVVADVAPPYLVTAAAIAAIAPGDRIAASSPAPRPAHRPRRPGVGRARRRDLQRRRTRGPIGVRPGDGAPRRRACRAASASRP